MATTIVKTTTEAGRTVEVVATAKGDAWRVRAYMPRQIVKPNEGTIRYSLDSALDTAASVIASDTDAVRVARESLYAVEREQRDTARTHLDRLAE